jgi:hypothetical protein
MLPGTRFSYQQGCSVPVILRSRAGGDYVVRNGYVEDITKGEALVGLQDHNWKEIDIHYEASARLF